MNLPNKLTVIRLFLIIPFLIAMGFTLSYKETLSFVDLNLKTIWFLISGVIFAVAMITDWLDGYIARKFDEITNFGKLFDPIADKFITSSAFIFLALLRVTPYFVPIIFILRDILVDGSRNLAAKYNQPIAANIWGKLKTITQTLSLLILFFVTPVIEPNALVSGFVSLNGYWELWCINLTTLIALVLSIVSGIIYFVNIMPLIKKNN